MEQFNIVVGSPVDYENLVAYIWIDGEEIALVHMEEGSEKMQVVFFEEKVRSIIYLDVLLAALQKAKEELKK